MDATSVLLVCTLLATCSVWTGHGRSLEVRIDDHEEADVGNSVTGVKLPGTCWACKWVLNKVKKVIGPNVTAEGIASVLSRACDQIGFLKSKCKTFVKDHLSVLVEELSTTDDVRSMCVNAGACKPKEPMELFLLSNWDNPQIVINENP